MYCVFAQRVIRFYQKLHVSRCTCARPLSVDGAGLVPLHVSQPLKKIEIKNLTSHQILLLVHYH